MARTLLIGAQYIKDNSPIDENVDERLMLDTIWTAQREHIKPLLGTDLYDDILAKAAAATLASNDLTLVNEYIAPCLTKWVMFEMTLIQSYKYRNKGVVQQNSENSQPTSYENLSHLFDMWRDKAEMFGQDLIRYVKANTDLFPLYLTNNDADDIHPINNNYTSGLYLGGGFNGDSYTNRDCCNE
jgi:hypothetical protein